jgi:gamma-glutamylcyclotransferase
MLYFAYGANMYHENMKKRCPEHKFIGRAVLKDYKFVYDGQSRLRGGGIGNIVQAPREVVWGGLYEITEQDGKMLDKYEGSPKYYQRMTVLVKNDEGQLLKAMVYRRPALTVNPPVPSYRQEILLGAEDCGLPEEYIKNNL